MVQGRGKTAWGERAGNVGDSQGEATEERKRGGGMSEKKERKMRDACKRD